MGVSSTHLYVGVNDIEDKMKYDYPFLPFLYLSFFCVLLSVGIFLNLESCAKNTYDIHTITDKRCVLDRLQETRVKKPKKIIFGHLNINSIPNKFDGIMNIVGNHIDIFLISETKIDNSFPDAQFSYEGYSKPYRKDRSLGAGGLLMYVNENIPSRTLNEHTLPNDVEIMCVELNLRKQKWVVMGVYRPPNMNERYFLDHLSRVIDYYSRKYDRVVIMGDFNSEPSDEPIETFCGSYSLHNLVKEKTCFKGPPKCYDLILTNCKHNFQNTSALTTGFSDFHKLTVTVLKTEFVKADPIKINYRNYNNYNHSEFSKELKSKLSNNVTCNNYNNFQNILCEVLEKHAPLKKKYLRANNSPFMTKQLRKIIMNRSRCKNAYFKNKTIENWEKYRKLRNECVNLTKKVKRQYFENLNINSVNDNKTFWKTVKPFFTDKNKKSGKIILVENNEIIMDNKRNAEVMNEYFVNITETLDIPEFPIEEMPANIQVIDPIDEIVYNFNKHPSIIKINNIIKLTRRFTFNNVDQKQIEK